MLGINKAPIIEGLESVLFRVAATANPKAIGRGECIGVIFQNPLLGVDGETPNTGSVWVGNSTDMIWLLIPGQESPLFYAEDLKDIYVKLLFPFPNPNGVITAAGPLLGSAGTGYTVGDVLILTSPGGDFGSVEVTATLGEVTGAAIQAAGVGYLVGDVLTLAATGGAQIIVTGIDGGGGVTTFDITSPGTTAEVGVQNALGGTGAGATVDITDVVGEILTLTVVAGGTLFEEGVNYPASGGTGEGAIIRVLVENSVPAVSNLCCLMYRLRKGGKQ